jgi:predicted nucleic acid-binding protein
MPWVEVVRVPDPPPAVPACRDPFDLPFLHLAVAGKARALVSGDRDLLVLAGAPAPCPVLGIDAFCRQFLSG